MGLGIGFVMPNLTTAIQNAVERNELGSATATAAFFRSLGGALGVALSGAVLGSYLKGLPAGIQATEGVAQIVGAARGATRCGPGRLPRRPVRSLRRGRCHRGHRLCHGAVPAGKAAARGARNIAEERLASSQTAPLCRPGR
jgi:hypothetical protein